MSAIEQRASGGGEADLLVAGQRVIRVRHRQLAGRPEELIARFAVALAAAR